jgi:hypothetical protein
METLILDIVIFLSLVCAIYFCWSLNKKLHFLKKLNFEITPALEALTKVSEHISKNMAKISDQMVSMRNIFGKEIPKAQGLKEDLEILLEYCESTTKQLESVMKDSKQTKKELDDILQLVAKALPRDMQNNLKNSSISVDFEILKSGKINDILRHEKDMVIPHKIDSTKKIEMFQFDEEFTKNMKDLH